MSNNGKLVLLFFFYYSECSIGGIPVTESPVNVRKLLQLSTNHEDPQLLQFLWNGFTHGFDIGFSGAITPGSSKNLQSARLHHEEVTEAINKEVSRGHTLGPFKSSPFDNLHISPLGAVPKKDGTYRLILDLSSPKGESINDGINKEDYSVSYSSFDNAVDMVRSLGVGAYMAKIDIKYAFRLCPVRVADFPLLGMFWQGGFYIDTRLPFGSRSSPFIFNQLASLLCWLIITVCGIVFVLHYLDDFILAARDSPTCSRFMSTVLSLFSYVGVPIAEDKLIGPSTCLTYLGIEIDSICQVIRLPIEKIRELRTTLVDFMGKRRCKKRQLLSLIGKLSFAAKVIKPGRLFLRHLINLSTSVDNLNYFIPLNKDTRDDLAWWLEALNQSNGVAYFQAPFKSSDELHLFTDASKTLGAGGVFGHAWFSVEWPPHLAGLDDINVKELYAIVIAFDLWGEYFTNQQIRFFSDNATICGLWRTHSVRSTNILKLLRHLFFKALSINCNIILTHIPGKFNVIADRCSRLQVLDLSSQGIPRDGPISNNGSSVNLAHLRSVAQYFIDHSLAPGTNAQYSRMYRDYKLFCYHSKLRYVPVSQEVLLLYCSYLSRRMGYKCIKSYLSGIRFNFIIRNRIFDLSNMHKLYYMLRGIRRVQGSSHSRPARSPISTTHLVLIHNLLYSGSYSVYERRLYWSASTLAFFGLLRVSEYSCPTIRTFSSEVNLLFSDISIRQFYISVLIKASKSDPFRKSCTLTIGPTYDLFCPVIAMRRFMCCRIKFGGPLYTFADGSYLTRQHMASLIKKACNDIHLNTHSFRIGGATALSIAGYSDAQIKIIGRWNSDCFVKYLRLDYKFCVLYPLNMAKVKVGSSRWDPDVSK